MTSDDLSFGHFEYTLTNGVQAEEQIARFLDNLIAKATRRRRKLSKGRPLCRAQIGYEMREDDNAGMEIPDAFLPERMKPLKESVSEGRVNPKGRPCLYLATDPATAIAEVRPWRGAYISLGRFKILRDCLLIDFSDDKFTSTELLWREEPPSQSELEAALWGDIAYAFAKPLTRNDDLSEYRATQAISERFRKEGYDGVAYRSAFGKGKCIALFDLDVAALSACALHEAQRVTCTYEQINNWYCIPKHHKHVADSMGLDISSPQAELPHFLRVVSYSPVEPVGGASDGTGQSTQSGDEV